MSNVEIRADIHSLTQVLETQVSRDTKVQVNPNGSTIISRIGDFTRINPLTLFGSKVEEDPQVFMDEVSKVIDIVGVSSQEKEELSAHQLNMWLNFGMSNGKKRGLLEKVRLVGHHSRRIFLIGYSPWN